MFFATQPIARPMPNSTGLISETQFGPTLTLAASLQPDTKHVFVVSGAGGREQRYEALAQNSSATSSPDSRSATCWACRPRNSSADSPRCQSDQSFSICSSIRTARAEDSCRSSNLARLAAVASRPMYSWVDSAFDHGVVGGSMRPIESEIQAVSDRALEVLRGKPADDIPTSSLDLFVDQVDWRQLRRWGISEARVPPGTIVKFRELMPGIATRCTSWGRWR